VLPGTHVDVLATANASNGAESVTTKVVLSNVEVLAAGTRLEQDSKDAKPIQVTVVTLLVTPEDAERLTLASTEGKIQLALRNPLDKTMPATRGIQPRALLGFAAPVKTAFARQQIASGKTSQVPVVVVPPAPEVPTVEIIRGDKRAREVVR
jgi:pilus assembly protein CpaB